jgi:GH15 family glucan-1,4-alpha-glucosidase
VPARIEDYALIGDGETAALVARDGSLDWLCWPRFDSAACFAALLGTPEHGRWLIAPAQPDCRVRREYRHHTLILETTFTTAEGEVMLVDFMPLRGAHSDIVRLVVGKRGRVRMQMELRIRFDYGASIPWVTALPDERGIRAVAGPDRVILRTPVELKGRDLTTVAEFAAEEGQVTPFVMTYSPSHLPLPDPLEPMEMLAHTEAFWTNWARRCTRDEEYCETISRSLITLKALIYQPTGGIVAAPTTSLPERIGGPRNWDYRYCWLRDATLTLLALMNEGFHDEAIAWRDWLLRAAAGSPAQAQIMYGLAGERRLTEMELPWLPGYEGSKPVCIGNAAASQLQLDVYGEVMDALHQARASGFPGAVGGWRFQRALMEHLETIWQQPDEGIWEVRGPRQHFTSSKVMCWVAFDRAVKGIEMFGKKGPLERWRRIRDQIHQEVCEKAFDRELNAFVQAYGSRQLDASALLIPTVGFLPPEDPRVVGTVAAIERRLMRDGFVMRYDTTKVDDGLPPGEGAFLACSFWLADAYLMLGRRADAQALFERLLALRNDVGLLAEEYDPHLRRQVGNFPQAFSHIALINTACNLVRSAKPAEQRSGQTAPKEREQVSA